ncbi:hypothetical protein VTK56DRAFT_9577 [Thermocarpiscus australiensis]
MFDHAASSSMFHFNNMAGEGAFLQLSNQLHRATPVVIRTSRPPERPQHQNPLQIDRDRFFAPSQLSPPCRPSFQPFSSKSESTMRKACTSGIEKVVANPPATSNVKIHVMLPAFDRGIRDVDPSDLVLNTLLSQIADEHESQIAIDEDGFTITAASRAKAKGVIVDLRKQLLYRPGEENVWRAHLLVNAPRDGKNRFRAVLQAKEGAVGVRPVSTTIPDLAPVDLNDAATAKTEYKEELNQTLDRVAEILRHDPNKMRMRVQFGQSVLDEWKKGKEEYTFTELGNLVRRAGARSTAHIVKIIKKGAVDALRSRILAEEGGLPRSVRDGLDPDTRPVYSLILQTKNLHVESVFDLVQGQVGFEKKEKQVQRYALGPLTVSPQEKRHRAAEIITVCPENSHDWAFEVRKVATEPDAKDNAAAPFTIKDLEGKLKFTGDALSGDFPNITVSNGFIRRHDIQKVHGKATWTYMLTLRYNLEISLFHMWEQNTSVPPATVAGLALYSSDWDDDMDAGNSQPRQWDSSFSEQFLRPYPGDEAPGEQLGQRGPLDHFLSWVHWIQGVLDDA